MVKKLKKSARFFLDEINLRSKELLKSQMGLSVGEMVSLYRKELGMSQEILSKRAKVPQSTISRVESNRQVPTIKTLKKLFGAMECEFLVSAVFRESPEVARRDQARKRAKVKIEYLRGTMSLEMQEPSQEFLDALFDDEVERLLRTSDGELWEEEL